MSRRALLRAGALAAGSVGLYAAGAAAISVLRLPGARRRFTGSYETASFRPAAMPTTSWLLDAVPAVDPDRRRLTTKDGQGRRELTLAELTTFDTQVRATLDCTSGWYSRQDWAGVPLATLLRRGPGAQSVYVHSVTGYWVRFPVHDLDRLLLATQVGGVPLSAAHGFPVRLVAPGGGATGGLSGSTASRCRPHRRGGSRRSRPADAVSAPGGNDDPERPPSELVTVGNRHRRERRTRWTSGSRTGRTTPDQGTVRASSGR